MAVQIFGNNFYSDDESDTFDGTGVSNYMSGGLGNDSINGLAGNDTIDGGVGDDNINGGDDDDTLTDVGYIPSGYSGLIGHDTIRGGKGNDRVNILSPDTGDFAYGDDGEDTINIYFGGTAFSSNAPIVFTLLSTGSVCKVNDINTVVVQGFERLQFFGNVGNDVVTGGALNDDISGEGGNDTLNGLGGNDTLNGGTGIQNIDGGEDFDTVSFDLTAATQALSLDITTGNDINLGAWGILKRIEAFNSIITGSGNDKIVNGNHGGSFRTNGGNDSLVGGNGDEVWNMGGGNDSGSLGAGSDQARVEGFMYDTGAKKVRGGAGNDYLFGAAGTDELFGDADQDFLNGQNGADKLYGGAGHDTLHGGGGNDYLVGGDGNDSLDADIDDYTDTAMAGDDTLLGGIGNDAMSGGVGSDRFEGSVGDDSAYLYWEGETVDTGLDTFDGGAGTDWYSVGWRNNQNWTYNIKAGPTIETRVNGTLVATAVNVETFLVQGNANGRYIYTGTDKVDSIRLGATGNDSIRTFGGDDSINASRGSDFVDAGSGNDTLSAALGGKDIIKGGAGNDSLNIGTDYSTPPETGKLAEYDLGAGIDTIEIVCWKHDITFQNGKDIFFEGTKLGEVLGWESMRLWASSTVATDFVGTAKNEDLRLSNLADKASMGGGDDFIDDGYGGKDIFDGGTGSDTMSYSYRFSQAISVTLNGSKVVTVTIGGLAEDKIKNFENLFGGGLGDSFTGDIEANKLDGGGGNDTLNGRDGDDILIGNVGKDVMTGGVGADQFAYVYSNASGLGSLSRDVITDFKRGTDKIDLRALDPNLSNKVDDKMIFVAGDGAAFTGKAGQVRFDAGGGITIVAIDMNGDRFADMEIELTGNIALAQADFLL